MNNEKKKFYLWLDNVMKVFDTNNIIGIVFNLYDDGDNHWSIELIGTGSFDINDEDWACDEVNNDTRDNPLELFRKCDYKEVLSMYTNFLKDYLEDGLYAFKLKSFKGIGIGFTDGDLEIIYHK